MKTKTKLKLVSLISLFAFTGIVHGKTLQLSPSNSKIEWKGEKITGSHNGVVKLKNGQVKLEEGQLKSGRVTVDMTTITNHDLEGKWKKKLEGHLNSDDFFSTKKYPESQFTIEDVTQQGDSVYQVKGRLKVKDQSHPAKALLKHTKKEGRHHFKGKLTFDRTKYGIKYNSGSFFDNLGDKMIYDDIELTINVGTK